MRIADTCMPLQVNIPARSAQLTVYGYTADTTSYSGNKATITYNQNAAAAGSNDASGTVRVQATNFKMYNVNVKNTCKSFLLSHFCSLQRESFASMILLASLDGFRMALTPFFDRHGLASNCSECTGSQWILWLLLLWIPGYSPRQPGKSILREMPDYGRNRLHLWPEWCSLV